MYYICDEGRYRETANAFGISRASISEIIRRVSFAVMTFVDPKLIRLPTTEVQELNDGYLEACSFPQCIGAIDGIHIEIAEPNEHYSNFINRKGYFSLKGRAVHGYKYCFQDVVVKWPGSSRLMNGRDPVPVYLLGDPAYPLP